jgi:hypothetical protein
MDLGHTLDSGQMAVNGCADSLNHKVDLLINVLLAMVEARFSPRLRLSQPEQTIFAFSRKGLFTFTAAFSHSVCSHYSRYAMSCAVSVGLR